MVGKLGMFILGGGVATGACLVSAWQPVEESVNRIGHITVLFGATAAVLWTANALINYSIKTFKLTSAFVQFMWERHKKNGATWLSMKKTEKVCVLRRHKYYIRIEDGALCRVNKISHYFVGYITMNTGTVWVCSRGSFQQQFRAAARRESRPFSKYRRQTLAAKLAELG